MSIADAVWSHCEGSKVDQSDCIATGQEKLQDSRNGEALFGIEMKRDD